MENAAIDHIIEKHGGEARKLIQILMEIQEENRWLPREVLKTVSERLGVSLKQVLRIATMYKTFSLVPKGRHEIHICKGNACHVRGAERLLKTVQDLTGLKPGETDRDSKFSLEIGCCRGNCCSGPVMEIGGKTVDKMSPAEALKNYE
ncbi:MAG TPA: NAD(P)H-dependent oxidoreductase subunit E [Verrucomicrobiae bacterium]|nr:NAD(P)H-dependent oxidoreductase subunit E [Verrucomicrobiae bacterium]